MPYSDSIRGIVRFALLVIALPAHAFARVRTVLVARTRSRIRSTVTFHSRHPKVRSRASRSSRFGPTQSSSTLRAPIQATGVDPSPLDSSPSHPTYAESNKADTHTRRDSRSESLIGSSRIHRVHFDSQTTGTQTFHSPIHPTYRIPSF